MSDETINDLREIRRRINMAAKLGERIDGKQRDNMSMSVAGSLAHSVLHIGEHEGLSGEDTMTMLAYHALYSYEKTLDLLLEWQKVTPSNPIIIPAREMQKK